MLDKPPKKPQEGTNLDHEQPDEKTPQSEQEVLIAACIELAKELSESREGFPFPGIDPGAYARLKAAEAEFPEYSSPTIDESIARLKAEGMKVALGQYPTSGQVFVLPRNSDDIFMDAIPPKVLLVTDTMDGRLKKLILAHRRYN